MYVLSYDVILTCPNWDFYLKQNTWTNWNVETFRLLGYPALAGIHFLGRFSQLWIVLLRQASLKK